MFYLKGELVKYIAGQLGKQHNWICALDLWSGKCEKFYASYHHNGGQTSECTIYFAILNSIIELNIEQQNTKALL